jgi:hypothetical protein
VSFTYFLVSPLTLNQPANPTLGHKSGKVHGPSTLRWPNFLGSRGFMISPTSTLLTQKSKGNGPHGLQRLYCWVRVQSKEKEKNSEENFPAFGNMHCTKLRLGYGGWYVYCSHWPVIVPP